MSKDYEKIYKSLGKHSSHNLEGSVTLKKVKKECKCLTDDILCAQSLHRVEKVNSCFMHTSIYDYGITAEDIRLSRINDK